MHFPARLSRLFPASLSRIIHFAAILAITVATGLASGNAAAAAPTVTLYAGQHEQMVRLLVDAFERQTGIHVDVRYGDGPELANQIILEGKRTPADVFFTENSPELQRLQEKGLLAPLDKSTLAQVPAKDSSATGHWVGVLARENVLTYNPKLIRASDLPTSILDFEKPQWKGKVGIHLGSPDIMPMIRTIALRDGRAAALKWVEGMRRNAKIYQQSSGTVLAVNNGDVPVGISNSYYYYRMRQQLGPAHTVSRIYHFRNGDPGGIVNISGAGVLRYGPHQALAQRLVAFMVSADAQTLLAASEIDFEYPLRPGIAANPALRPLDQLEPPKVTVEQLGNDGEALQLLQQAGVL